MANNKSKNKELVNYKKTWADSILDNPIACVVAGLVAIVFGAFFIFLQSDNKPITKAEAEAYTGSFEKYRTGSRYCEIYFEDGSIFDVYPHTETQDFRDKMKSIEKGTVIHLLVNSNNGYVAEVRTDNEEILNFIESQEAIDRYDNGYICIGIFVIASGVFLIIIGYMHGNYKNKEEDRQRKKNAKRHKERDDPVIRYADFSVKYRILLEKEYKGYKICYRRVNHKNELVVNGRVYDEKGGIIEFSHNLSAQIDGHLIEAGYDGNETSYMNFDGKRIAQKRRYI